jgi:hypothetical protein
MGRIADHSTLAACTPYRWNRGPLRWVRQVPPGAGRGEGRCQPVDAAPRWRPGRRVRGVRAVAGTAGLPGAGCRDRGHRRGGRARLRVPHGRVHRRGQSAAVTPVVHTRRTAAVSRDFPGSHGLNRGIRPALHPDQRRSGTWRGAACRIEPTTILPGPPGGSRRINTNLRIDERVQRSAEVRQGPLGDRSSRTKRVTNVALRALSDCRESPGAYRTERRAQPSPARRAAPDSQPARPGPLRPVILRGTGLKCDRPPVEHQGAAAAHIVDRASTRSYRDLATGGPHMHLS